MPSRRDPARPGKTPPGPQEEPNGKTPPKRRAAGEGRRGEPLFVASLEKGLRVLKAFGEDRPSMGLGEIAAATGLDKSAAQRFANTLYELGYLTKDPVTRRYQPGVRLLDLAFPFLCHNRLAEVAIPRLIEAGRVYDTTVNLCQLDGLEIVYTLRIPNEKSAFIATVLGRRMPAYCTAGGVVMLAFRPDEEVEAIVDASDRRPMTRHTIVERDAVLKRIAKARENGYDVGVSQAQPNEISVAAPIFDRRKQVFAAVQIPILMPRWTEAAAHRKIAPLAIEIARGLSGQVSPEEMGIEP
ncbi:IclR family transcriptional regulator [Kaustia mangrovi]|uniref:IclR family transcriptional regulator n=1 Tax=Kaustia mangrovi TaxID=2593653 RepID=A0A7S8HD87_9HYPH|nr:IclR family transcriptional regulator [Kaustia mangrovi]QPC44370.1 IclR family transcriptional regulator [Kaustia mangrovi]